MLVTSAHRRPKKNAWPAALHHAGRLSHFAVMV
jgi:hypothetical protein